MAQPSHSDLDLRLERGEVRFGIIEDKLNEVLAVVIELKGTVKEVESKVEQTKEIVEAWDTVKTVGRFTKWMAGIIVAIAGAIAGVKATLALLVR